MGFAIEQIQRPTLVLAHNKTLAAQLCSEFREFFPDNAVEYFVSYYDYYQPEAYVPHQDLYIEKDSSINDEIDRLRHAATASLFAREDVIIVASVSCIYGIGSPELYKKKMLLFKQGEWIDRDDTLRKLVSMQYVRNDANLARGNFRVRGEVLEVHPAYAESAYRIQLFGDEIEQIQHFDPLTGEIYHDLGSRLRLAGDPLRDVRGHRRALAVGDAGASSRSASSGCRRTARSWRPTACASAPSTTWRCSRRWASARASRTTRESSTAARPARRRTR